jgi:hypothetical protein
MFVWHQPMPLGTQIFMTEDAAIGQQQHRVDIEGRLIVEGLPRTGHSVFLPL